MNAKTLLGDSGMDSLRSSYQRAMKQTTIGTLFASVLGVLVMIFSYPLFFGPDYQISWTLGVVLVLGASMIPGMIFVGAFSTVRNNYRAILVGSLVAVITSVISSAVIVPYWGITGAFAAILLSYFSRYLAISILNK